MHTSSSMERPETTSVATTSPSRSPGRSPSRPSTSTSVSVPTETTTDVDGEALQPEESTKKRQKTNKRNTEDKLRLMNKKLQLETQTSVLTQGLAKWFGFSMEKVFTLGLCFFMAEWKPMTWLLS